MIIRDPEATADDFIELAARLGLHGTDYVVGWTAWMDLSPVGVSKASGLQHVCDELGLSAADVLAIGDGRNDIEMLRWAGRGVAMGQSVDEVKAAADFVTDSVVRRRRGRRDVAMVPAAGRDVTRRAGRHRPRRDAARPARVACRRPDPRRCSTSWTRAAYPSSSPPVVPSAGWRTSGRRSAATGWRSAATAVSSTTSRTRGPRPPADRRATCGLALADAVRAAIPGTTFAVEHTDGWASEADFPRHPDDVAIRVQGSWEEIFRDDVVKVLAVHRDLDPEDFWDRVAQAVGDSVVTTWSSSFALVEISAAGVTKASHPRLRSPRRWAYAPSEVVAFGDMPNDLPMLEWAGTSYAMANAHRSVLDLADHLAPGNDEDGVAAVLADLFDLRG